MNRDTEKINEDTNDNDTDKIVKFKKTQLQKFSEKIEMNKEIQKRLMKIKIMIHMKQ